MGEKWTKRNGYCRTTDIHYFEIRDEWGRLIDRRVTLSGALRVHDNHESFTGPYVGNEPNKFTTDKHRKSWGLS